MTFSGGGAATHAVETKVRPAEYQKECVAAAAASSPHGVVHARHGEVGGQVGSVGRTHDEGEEPPAAHDDAQSH